MLSGDAAIWVGVGAAGIDVGAGCVAAGVDDGGSEAGVFEAQADAATMMIIKLTKMEIVLLRILFTSPILTKLF